MLRATTSKLSGWPTLAVFFYFFQLKKTLSPLSLSCFFFCFYSRNFLVSTVLSSYTFLFPLFCLSLSTYGTSPSPIFSRPLKWKNIKKNFGGEGEKERKRMAFFFYLALNKKETRSARKDETEGKMAPYLFFWATRCWNDFKNQKKKGKKNKSFLHLKALIFFFCCPFHRPHSFISDPPCSFTDHLPFPKKKQKTKTMGEKWFIVLFIINFCKSSSFCGRRSINRFLFN